MKTYPTKGKHAPGAKPGLDKRRDLKWARALKRARRVNAKLRASIGWHIEAEFKEYIPVIMGDSNAGGFNIS